MEGVDISQYSEEEQKILRQVFARQQQEDEKDKKKYRDEQMQIQLLEAAVYLRQREKSGADLEATCHICAKTKFADGIGHICNQCRIRCCARCGVKVQFRHNKIWLCVLCRKKKELSIKFGKWVKSDPQKPWGRSRSLEEEADAERRVPHTGLLKQFPSAINIATPTLSFWNDDKHNPRPEPVVPARDDLPPSHLRSDANGTSNNRRYTRRRSSLDTVRNDSLSSDQSENPPRPPRPKKAGNNSSGGHRYRRSGSSESEDEARSTPSSYQDSESDRVSLRKERPAVRCQELRGWRSQEDYHPTTTPHSVYWKRDGDRYLGHLILRKDLLPDGRARQSIGMKVVGGQRLDDDRGTIGAIVQNIREGSIADKIARIEPGDEVLEWNGRRLRGMYKEEVASIIALSKNEPQVQLLLSRPYGRNVSNPVDPCEMRRVPPPHLEIHPEAMQRGPHQESRYKRYPERPVGCSTKRSPIATIGGRIQVRLWYDHANQQLVVTVECAKELPPRKDFKSRNPYVKIVLLPDKSEKGKRRSKTIARTNDPQWKQNFVFTHLRQTELRSRSLQINVWDYDRKYAYSDFLGEVVIPLRANLTDEAQWYPLSMHRDEEKTSPLASPTASRMSDEELSDFDEKFSEHTERRIMAVDSSPPFYEDRPVVMNPYTPLAMTSPMGERSRSLTAPTPSCDYSRGRMRETGFGDRRRSRSMAEDSTIRTIPGHGSRSVSPPQYRPQFPATPRPSTSQRLLPPQNSFRKRQLPQVPYSRSDLEDRYLRSRNSLAGSTSGGYAGELVSRRGGGSRMAAALGVSVTSPLVSPDRSDSESSSKFNLSSAFHRNSRTFDEFATGRPSSAYGGPVHPSSRAELDGSLSDTAVGLVTESKAMVRRTTDGANRSPYLSKKSNSTSQLSVTGHKKRLIFRRRNGSSSSFVVQRSEEILPDVRAGSSISSDGSISGDSLSWGARLPSEVGEASGFVEGLGPGQLVGRQVLASPSLGEVQLGIQERKNCLEVEVIRARGLMPKANAKVLPAPYVKVYLLNGRKCVAKRKTAIARRTLDPLYQNTLIFQEDFRNCCLQVTVWGNYNSIEKKVFMGVAQIVLNDIDLVTGVINWYKLFHQSSLVTSLAANDHSSFLSLDSFG